MKLHIKDTDQWVEYGSPKEISIDLPNGGRVDISPGDDISTLKIMVCGHPPTLQIKQFCHLTKENNEQETTNQG